MRKFYICRQCGNIVEMVHESGVPVFCCGKKMDLLEPNTVEASGEKHVPVAEVNGSEVKVTVGSVPHPMEKEHFIEWIYLETDSGGQRADLKPGDSPEAVFCIGSAKPIAVYAYCNLHGLWKAEM